MMIGKLLLGRVMPLGAAAFFLRSSVSPIKPALAAFEAATAALTGENVHMEASFPGTEGGPPLQLPTAVPDPKDAKKALAGLADTLLGGGGHPDEAKAQLDGIINDVKYHGHPPAPAPATPAQGGQQPALPRAKGPELKLSKGKGK